MFNQIKCIFCKQNLNNTWSNEPNNSCSKKEKQFNSQTESRNIYSDISELIFPIINLLCTYCHLLSMSNYF